MTKEQYTKTDNNFIELIYNMRSINRSSRNSCKSEADIYVNRVTTRRYKAQVQSVSPTELGPRLLAENDACALLISLGNSSMEKAKLEASIEWVSKNFERCALIVSNTLYRHTLQVTQGVPADKSRDQAMLVGEKFQIEYGPLIDHYSKNCHFQWLPVSEMEQRSNFKIYIEAFRKLYKENELYQEIVDDFSQIYLGRTSGRDLTLSHPQKIDIAVEYLLEETAIITCLCEENWNILVYPGSIKSFIDIAEGHITEIPEALRRIVFVSLRLKKAGLYFADGEAGFYPAAIVAENVEFSTYPLLAKLNVDNLKKFLTFTYIKEFKAGDIILRKEESANLIIFPLHGCVEILEEDTETKKLKQMAILGPGTSVGGQNFLDREALSNTVVAYTNCKILVLTERRIEKMLANEPFIAAHLLLDIARMISLRHRGVL